MSLDTIFTFLLLLVVVVAAVAVGGAIYIAAANRRTRREKGRRVGTADVPVGVGFDEEYGSLTGKVEPHDLELRREFYKSMGLETTEDIKLRLYYIEQYRVEFGGAYTAKVATLWPRSKHTGNWATRGSNTPRARRRTCSSLRRRTTR